MTDKTKAVTLTKVAIDDLQLGSTQLAFNKKVDAGFNAFEKAIDQAIVDLTGHKTAIDEVSVVADGAAAKAQQGVDNAATAQTQADKGVRDAATAQAKAEQVETDYKAADTAITEAYTQADTDLQSTIESAYKAADGEVTSAYKAADENVKKEATKYVNATKVINGVGGITSGTSFEEGTTVQQVLDMLLYPYIQPSISGSASEAGGTREKGTEVTIRTITAEVTKKARAITKVEALGIDGSVVGTKSEGVQDGGSTTFTLKEPIKLDGKSDKSVSVRVTDADQKSYTASAGSYTFIYPSFHGVVASATPDALTVAGLTKEIWGKATRDITYTTNDNYACYAFPASYKKLVQILDPNGFDVTSTFACQELMIACKDGTSQNYNVYTTVGGSTVAGFVYKFGFQKLK